MIFLIPITAFLCAWIWIDVWRMPERYLWSNRKPLNCPMCLSMWFALVLYFVPVMALELLFVTTLAALLGAWAEN